ncbi:MAG: hypothetical protein IJ424_00365 [Oscillospiraceae bacterium]|nr:hypothetical protein [Oscillospiraceae bacterium]
MKVNVIGAEMDKREIDAYVSRAYQVYPNKTIEEMTLTVDGDFVDIEYKFAPKNFDRIRRITGYLVGTLDRFNNAKRAEVDERVKHGV